MKTKKLLVVMLVFIVASLTLTGCFSSDEEKIKATIDKHFEGLKKEDIKMVGETLDASFEAEGENKVSYLASVSASFGFIDFTDIKVVYESVSVTGDTAVATCAISVTAVAMGETMSNSVKEEFTMVKNGSDWLIKTMVQK